MVKAVKKIKILDGPGQLAQVQLEIFWYFVIQTQ